MDCSPPGFSVHGISQARILEWVCCFLPQGIFLTQGSNLHLLRLRHCRGNTYVCVCVCVSVCVYLNHFAVYLKCCRYTSIKKKLILQWLNKIKIISYSFLYSHLVVVVQSLNCVWFLRPHGLLCQAPLSTGFPRQEYWSGLPFPSPGDRHDPGIKPSSPTCRFFTTEPPGKPCIPS